MKYFLKFSFLILFFFIFTSNSSYSKDLATWGATGAKCSQAVDIVNRFGKMGRETLGFSIQGFLTGYNSHVMLMDLQNKSSVKAKVINKYSITEITNILIGKCTASPSKATYIALIEIWRTFPDAKY